MIIPTQEQLYERWDLISETLREALFSSEAEEFIRLLFEQNEIPEENIDKAIAVVGFVILGFLPQENLAEEWMAQAGIEETIAHAAAESVISHIITPLQADIQAIPVPTSPKARPAVKTPVLQDVNSPKIISAAPPTPPTFKSQAAQAPLSEKGWSQIRSMTGAPAKPAFSKPIPPGPRQPQPTQSVKAPQPMVILQKPTFTIPQQNMNFRIPRTEEMAEVNMNKGTAQQKAPVAIVDFGKRTGPQASNRTATQATPNMSDSGPRIMTEVARAVAPTPTLTPTPVPLKPPLTPTPKAAPQPSPRPPQAPSAPQALRSSSPAPRPPQPQQVPQNSANAPKPPVPPPKRIV